ncbi:shikimate kinase [Desulfatiferula olefinivorans]
MSNLYLTGYRCTGKTSVGRNLADMLGWSFVDADRLLVDEAGMSVAEIVARFGWEDFRDRESAVLKRLSEKNRQVVATGGGVILRDVNRDIMKKTGRVVWLKASVLTIARRMENDSVTGDQRPGLTDQGAIREIETVLNERTPLYTAAMDMAVDTDGRSIDDICREIAGQGL